MFALGFSTKKTMNGLAMSLQNLMVRDLQLLEWGQSASKSLD
jgi:hypothetical protein